MLQRLLFLLVVFSSSVFAEEQGGLEWLEKMSRAMKELNYQGTVAFMKNGQLDTMKYSHAAKNGVEQERLLSLNSPMREVIRDSGKISCTFKESQKRIVNHRPVSQSFIIDLPQQISQLAAVYKIVVSGEEAVAMRPARVLDIQPRDDYRYSRKVWLDKQRLLPLKIEVYDLNGAILEQVVFTDLSVEPQIPFLAIDNHEGDMDVQHIHRVQSESFDKIPFQLHNLPVGFNKVFFTRMSMHQSSQPVEHLLLSDGFSSISIYLDEKTEDMEVGLQNVGSVNSFTRIIADSQVTVLGEVPAKTVEYIAQGITFN
ncbi:MucB/RseB C-terminal domain-containing protein [Methylomarinum sp. Ch1-1]|uniref:MucB/RseB C-terminal domain-containing protein n=1 Tax=Methylomarinum roseum TaxID=3067653 RepID=A0AAU7NSW3_9GAMM|nr:MucB/RseB C-terminal domain-containing protein [Methylomarinum sp. Ch1-1]MDP4519942.1 MucB/RseB C-terminal domain-containing protein [Methylomarinum sp. Ch1-1]